MFVKYYAEAKMNYEILHSRIRDAIIKEKGRYFFFPFSRFTPEKKTLDWGQQSAIEFYNMGIGKTHLMATIRANEDLEVWNIAEGTGLFKIMRDDDPRQKWIKAFKAKRPKVKDKLQAIYLFAVLVSESGINETTIAQLIDRPFEEIDELAGADGLFLKAAIAQVKKKKLEGFTMSVLYDNLSIYQYYLHNKEKLNFPPLEDAPF